MFQLKWITKCTKRILIVHISGNVAYVLNIDFELVSIRRRRRNKQLKQVPSRGNRSVVPRLRDMCLNDISLYVYILCLICSFLTVISCWLNSMEYCRIVGLALIGFFTLMRCDQRAGSNVINQGKRRCITCCTYGNKA